MELCGDFSPLSLKLPANALAIAAIMTVIASMSMTPTTGENCPVAPVRCHQLITTSCHR